MVDLNMYFLQQMTPLRRVKAKLLAGEACDKNCEDKIGKLITPIAKRVIIVGISWPICLKESYINILSYGKTIILACGQKIAQKQTERTQ